MNPTPFNRLIAAIIQMQDEDEAVKSLNDVGFEVTRFATSGGFLGRRNVTLLIWLTKGQEPMAVAALNRSCRRRVEYIATSLEGAPFHLPLSTPITVGGATIFSMKIDRYEVI